MKNVSNVEVKIRQQCERCERGYVYNPLFVEFNRWWDRREKELSHLANKQDPHPLPSDSEIKEWWSEQGYARMPPEEETCGNCQGTTWIERWVKLEDLNGGGC